MTTRRTYDATGRRAAASETRARIIAAATTLFAARGWAGASVREVARASGVAVETVYAAVGTKTALLRAAIEVAVVGDDRESPLAEREAFLALASGDQRQRVRAATELLLGIHRRGARVICVLREAAQHDPEMAVLNAELRAQQVASFTEALRMVARRPPEPHEVQALLALASEETYLTLADEFGWPETRIADLVIRSINDILQLEEETDE